MKVLIELDLESQTAKVLSAPGEVGARPESAGLNAGTAASEAENPMLPPQPIDAGVSTTNLPPPTLVDTFGLAAPASRTLAAQDAGAAKI